MDGPDSLFIRLTKSHKSYTPKVPVMLHIPRGGKRTLMGQINFLVEQES